MEAYRFYLLNDGGEAVTYRDVQFTTDAAAIQHARELVDVIACSAIEAITCSAIEVWRAGRLVHFEYPASNAGATARKSNGPPLVPGG